MCMAETEKCIWDKFTNQYSLSKTLRFELKPVGKTEENIKLKGLVSRDELRARDYKEVKEIIDNFHRDFIERALRQVEFGESKLQEFYSVYEGIKKLKRDKKDDVLEKSRKELSGIQKDFRKKIRKQIERVDSFRGFV